MSEERQSYKGKPFTGYGIRTAVVAGMLMLLSGRIDWMRAWAMVALTFVLQAGVGALLLRTNPELLEERSRIRKGTKSWDRFLAPAVALGPLATFTVAALDVRAHWPPPVPILWSTTAFAICAVSGLFTAWAMHSNPFFSATVRIQAERGHVVVDGGPYRYLRHPGYAGALAFTIACPVAMGSWRAVLPALAVGAVLIVRTALEDRTLRRELTGYGEYAKRVPQRLMPGVW